MKLATTFHNKCSNTEATEKTKEDTVFSMEANPLQNCALRSNTVDSVVEQFS